MLDLKRKHYPLSFLLGAMHLTTLMYQSYYLVIVEITTLLLKYHYEGFRVNIFFYALSWIAYIIGLPSLSVLLVLAYLGLATKLVNYQLPHSGPPVGHKYIKGGWLSKYTKIPELAIYYPADHNDVQNKKCGYPWLKVPGYAKKMEDTAKKDIRRKRRVPLLFFQTVVSQFYKFVMHVYEGAKIDTINHGISKNNSRIYPTIILSPGLASHCDGYSVICRYLAQQGYIILVPEHDENVRNIHVGDEENRVYRQGQLVQRVATIKQLLDIIYDQHTISSLFPQDQIIRPDLTEVSLLGHSFGGATAIQVSVEDPRITGCCITYDPCLYVFPDGMNTNVRVPIMSINADDFYRRLYPFMHNDERISNMFNSLDKQIQEHSTSIYIKDQQHADFSDIPIIWNGESGLYKISKNIHEVHLRFGMILTLTKFFLKESIQFHESNGKYQSNQELQDKILQYMELNFGKSGRQLLRWTAV